MKNKAMSPSTLRKVLRRVRRYMPLIILSLCLTALTVAATLYLPVLAGQAIDGIVGPGQVDFQAILQLLIRGLVVIGITALAQWILNMVNNSLTFNVIRDIRAEAFSKIQELPLSYLDSHSSGDIVSRIITDADTFAEGLLMGFTQLFSGVLTILGTIAFMVSIHPAISLLVILLTPLSLFAARFIARRTYSMFTRQSEVRGEQTALIDEMISNQKVVQAFGYEQKALSRFDEVNKRLHQCSLKATFFSSLTNPTTRFINNLVYAGVALASSFCVIGGTLTVGYLSVLLNYANQYTRPFNEISGVITELQNAMACAARLFELIEEKPQVSDRGLEEMPKADGEVVLDHVSFSYTPEQKLLQDLCLTVKPGQRIAIVGPTGCGKTTLINLLMRFYDVRDGSISVDGRDIRKVTRHSLRRNYGMVLQETWLKSGTIRSNITMGRPDATEEEIVAAAKAAHAHSFIKRLPDGYDTIIGEDGGSLSQGQKQLLCIARIMLCMPPMLILDEATSSIDTRTEIKIQEAFAHLMQGKTSFIVAHRLSTIRQADIILVMKDGNIIEKGNHESLMAQNGFYAALYNSQFEGTQT